MFSPAWNCCDRIQINVTEHKAAFDKSDAARWQSDWWHARKTRRRLSRRKSKKKKKKVSGLAEKMSGVYRWHHQRRAMAGVGLRLCRVSSSRDYITLKHIVRGGRGGGVSMSRWLEVKKITHKYLPWMSSYRPHSGIAARTPALQKEGHRFEPQWLLIGFPPVSFQSPKTKITFLSVNESVNGWLFLYVALWWNGDHYLLPHDFLENDVVA